MYVRPGKDLFAGELMKSYIYVNHQLHGRLLPKPLQVHINTLIALKSHCREIPAAPAPTQYRAQVTPLGLGNTLTVCWQSWGRGQMGPEQTQPQGWTATRESGFSPRSGWTRRQEWGLFGRGYWGGPVGRCGGVLPLVLALGPSWGLGGL